MKINLIIGAGQLGGRHLQGLLKYSQSQNIFVLDPSPESLELTKNRAQEIQHNHTVSFINNWYDIPKSLDLVIVATNADVREQVVSVLLTNYEVKYLILEKVLFQELDSYLRVSDLIKKYKVTTWVNHPRRMFESYKSLKQLLNRDNQKIMQITGGNWGLGCNTLHFIDLFMYLTDSKLHSLDANWLDKNLLPSKRKGFIEYTGCLKGKLDDGSIFQITSLKGEPTPCTITIFEAGTRVFIQETGTPQIYILRRETNFAVEVMPFKMEFQSSLTTKLIEDLFMDNKCNLPTYDLAAQTHMVFIHEMLKRHNKLTKSNNKKLPVT